MTKRLLLVSLSVAWVAALLCVPEVLSAGDCDPDCSGKDPQDMVKDPLDCTKYYVCLEDGIPSDVSLSCPVGEYFNPALATPKCARAIKCSWVVCQPKPCHLTCTTDPDIISDKNNCSRYYTCQGGNILGPYECSSATPYFNGSICVSDASVCCDLCIAYCYAGVVEAPDPYDCHMYYMCSGAGLVNTENHYSCPSGENFDLAMSRCVTSAACTSLCGGNPEPDCLDSMTCTSVGFFPRCTTCEQQYFNCGYVGQPAVVGTCLNGMVFNTDPNYSYCVLPTECPFHPQL